MVIIDSLLVVKRKGILVVFYPVTIVSHVDAVIEGNQGQDAEVAEEEAAEEAEA